MEPVKFCDPDIYGVDWDISAVSKRIKEKPLCDFPGCTNRVSTTYNRLKPYCTDHVMEYSYAQDVQRRLTQLNENEDRKNAAEAFKKLKQAHDDSAS